LPPPRPAQNYQNASQIFQNNLVYLALPQITKTKLDQRHGWPEYLLNNENRYFTAAEIARSIGGNANGLSQTMNRTITANAAAGEPSRYQRLGFRVAPHPTSNALVFGYFPGGTNFPPGPQVRRIVPPERVGNILNNKRQRED
jgi:hypothetical protein